MSTEKPNIVGNYTYIVKNSDGDVIGKESGTNILVTEGEAFFMSRLATSSGVATLTATVMGLFDDPLTVSASDTYASPNAAGENSNYTGNRPAWDGDVSSNSLVHTANSGVVDFAISADSQTIGGFFVCGAPSTGAASVVTKGNTSATGAVLISEVDFTSPPTLNDGDTLSITYTIDFTWP